MAITDITDIPTLHRHLKEALELINRADRIMNGMKQKSDNDDMLIAALVHTLGPKVSISIEDIRPVLLNKELKGAVTIQNFHFRAEVWLQDESPNTNPNTEIE